MSVDQATVRRIARLARIAVTDEEVPHLQGELNAMLSFVEQLNSVNVEGVEPMTSVTPMAMKKRVDAVTDGGLAEDVVRHGDDAAAAFLRLEDVDHLARARPQQLRLRLPFEQRE